MENTFTQIIRVVLALIAVVAFMLVLYKYAGKFKLNLNLKQKTTPYALRKLDMIHLGYRKFVSVVEVKDQILVIGMGEKELSLLARWTKEEGEK